MDRVDEKANEPLPPSSVSSVSVSSVDEGLLRTLKFMLRAGMLFLSVGAALQLIEEGSLETNVSLFELWEALSRFDPAGWVALGVALLILGPAVGLGYLVRAFLREREPQVAAFAVGILVVMVGSLALKSWMLGGMF
jgi:uncharacterized membrane protein